MSHIKSTIIAQFIALNDQVLAWNFKREGRLPQPLIDHISLIRRWAWDNGLGPAELHLAALIHKGANETIIADVKRTMKSWQYYKDKQDQRQLREGRLGNGVP